LERHNLPWLAKPFLVEELKLAVHRALERSQRLERADDEVGDTPPHVKTRSAHNA
jgi:hypothetical protein